VGYSLNFQKTTQSKQSPDGRKLAQSSHSDRRIGSRIRVARKYIFKQKIKLGKFWKVLQWKMLVNFVAIRSISYTAISYILWQFGIFCGHFVIFCDHWYILFSFWYILFSFWYSLFSFWYIVFSFWYILWSFWYILWSFWYILWSFWYIFNVLVFCTKKNLATLNRIRSVASISHEPTSKSNRLDPPNFLDFPHRPFLPSRKKIFLRPNIWTPKIGDRGFGLFISFSDP
jgi:hypothetical protein